ncbi:MAG: hypothetical protein II797_01635 [Clostridia bacterium]|nr:hypothetical protein [Clostridia bacterium]
MENRSIRLGDGKNAGEARPSAYLKRISGAFGVAKYLILLALILFIAFMVLLHSESMTYANLRYLLKDFNLSNEQTSGNFDAAYYEKQQSMSFILFRGELAVAGKNKLTLYPALSQTGTDYPLGYSDPRMLSSDKYLLVYDLGGKDYSLYNSLTCVFSEKADGTITGCSMGQDGSYAILTRSSKAKYQIELYDSKLKKEATYYLDDYAVASALSEDGKRLAILTTSVDSADLDSKLRLASAGRDSYDRTVSLGDELPLEVRFFSSGTICVLCDRSIRFFDADGNEIRQESVTSLSHAAFGSDGVSLVFSSNAVGSENDIVLYDGEGNRTSEAHAPFKILLSALGEDGSVYLLSSSEVYRLKDGQLRSRSFSGSVLTLLTSDQSLFLCRTTSVLTWAYDEEGGFS